MIFYTALLLAATSQSVAAQQCHQYVLISVRGTTEPQGPSVGFTAMIAQTLGNLTGGIEYDAVYPADESLRADIGGADVQRYINDGLKTCPEQTYAVLGYSQGASATAIGLRNLVQDNETAAIDAVKAVVVIGNPGHVPYATANVDQKGGSTTRQYAGSYYFGGAGRIPELYYLQDKILDICYQGDSVCAPTYPNASFAPYHLLYPGDAHVQEMGSNYLVKKLSGGSGLPTSTNSTNSTASVPVYRGAASTTLLSWQATFAAAVGVLLTAFASS